mgnify:CR=1 FL=1
MKVELVKEKLGQLEKRVIFREFKVVLNGKSDIVSNRSDMYHCEPCNGNFNDDEMALIQGYIVKTYTL